MAYNNSGSSSTTWEGIEGFNPEFLSSQSVLAKQNALRQKQKQELMSGQALADKYGFIFGQDKINAMYQDAAKQKYDQIEGLTRQARDTSLTDMSANYDQYLQNMRDQKANSMQTGISRGSNIAAEVQGLLGAQDTTSNIQTQYSKDLAGLADERGVAAQDAIINAAKFNNDTGSTLAQIASELYGYDVQDEAAYLSYLGQYDANTAAMLQSGAAWNDIQGKNTRKVTSQQNSWASSGDSGGSGSGSGGSGTGSSSDDAWYKAAAKYTGIGDKGFLDFMKSEGVDLTNSKEVNKLYDQWLGSGGGGGGGKTPANASKPGTSTNWKPGVSQGPQGSWAGSANGLFGGPNR